MEIQIALIAAGAALAGSAITQAFAMVQAARARRWSQADRRRDDRQGAYVEALTTLDDLMLVTRNALVHQGDAMRGQRPSKEVLTPAVRAVGRVDLLAPAEVRDACQSWFKHTAALINFAGSGRSVGELADFVRHTEGEHTDDTSGDNNTRRAAFVAAARRDLDVGVVE